MISSNRCTVSVRTLPKLRRWLGAGLLLCAGLQTGGCSYFEGQLARPPKPETRVRLGWQDQVQVIDRELPKYTCPARYFLLCDHAAGVYTCHCSPL